MRRGARPPPALSCGALDACLTALAPQRRTPASGPPCRWRVPRSAAPWSRGGAGARRRARADPGAPPRARRHVIIETNKTTARIFPEVPDCEAPEFWERMERLIVLNKKLLAIGASDAPGALKTLRRLPVLERFAAELLQLFIGKHVVSGTYDFESTPAAAY